MVYQIDGSDEELEYIGLDKEMQGERVVKLGEFFDGDWLVFYQTYKHGFYWSYEYDIPQSLLKKL